MEETNDSKKAIEYVMISSEVVDFGKNNFLEVARKKAVTDKGETEFISLSRGYYQKDRTKRFKSSISIPDDPQVRAFIADKLTKI